MRRIDECGGKMEKELLIEVNDLSMQFGLTKALKNVNMKFYRGEIRGLIGENGSGKSTVASIISGMQPASSGTMTYKGNAWNPSSMVDAQRQGISMVLQEANTVPGCTVAENLFAGRFDECSKFGFVDMKAVNAKAQALLNRFDITNIKATDSLERLSFEDRKLVEIVRCVTEDTQVCVFDETTTALSLEGRKILYKLIHELKDAGKCVIFISHDMDEIMEQCTDLTVLRDGNIIGHLDREEMDAAEAVKKIRFMMVGREIGDAYYREDYDTSHGEEVALELKNVSRGSIKNFSLKLHKGEIIGLGGLSGCGMHEIGRAAFGLEKLSAGSVEINGKSVTTPLQAINAGAGYISKNRDTEALILEGSINDNISLPLLPELSHLTHINSKEEKRYINEAIEAFRIKCNSGKQWVDTLSGGNKQKISFAKWHAKNSNVLIMDCPTRGVDIGVKQSMYALIAQMKKEGKAILLISEEMAELIGMADKLIIMKDFKMSGEIMREVNLKETDIIEYMI